MKTNVEDANEKISLLSTQLEESTGTNNFLEEKIAKLSVQLQEQENENNQLLKERNDREKEMENFSKQLEERILIYKGILDEKQRDIDILNEKYENLIEKVPGIDVDDELSEIKRLTNSIKERDKVLSVYDEKIHLLSTELVETVDIIEKINDEKMEFSKKLEQRKINDCCFEIQEMLKRAKEERKELIDLLQIAENDNLLKSQQAFEAIEALKSYENSKDGLADALKKIHQLQEAVHQRDKQIQEFVTELNAQNEISAENSVLRKRLGIPDDEIIETRTFLAKQKRYAKINDRLQLRLRASEELRLQLKIDKNDLKRKISDLEAKLSGIYNSEKSISTTETPSSSPQADIVDRTRKGNKENRVEMRQCQNCSTSYNVFESLKHCRNCIIKHTPNFCENCTTIFKSASSENTELIKKITKLEIDYQSVVTENENLREGLNEILQKLRSYEGIKYLKLFLFVKILT